MTSRRRFLSSSALSASALSSSAAPADDPSALVVDPQPLFDISPLLFMQFMEPLGVTDSSVEAAWDYERDDWRRDFLAASEDLGPQTLRWGGLYCRYYKWREGVGPAARRPSHRNYVWGGKETNRVGTAEFVSLCRRTGAEPLICVNFLSDGVERFRRTGEGDRSGDAREAADWVSYANDPDNKERRAHGDSAPYGIRLWQIGNETSYGNATFTRQESITHTIEFARAMKQRDPSIQIAGWGDRGREGYWAPDLWQQAGEHLDFVAFHMMGQGPIRKNTILRGNLYQKDPAQAWDELLELAGRVETRVREFEQAAGPKVPIAVTEGHLSLPYSNSNPLLLEWLSAVYHARSWNTYLRHGDRIRIATISDFEGTRWTVNSLLLQVPGGASYLTPAGAVSRLFRRHHGRQGVKVTAVPAGLDASASRDASTIYLHVVNTRYDKSVEARFVVPGATTTSGCVFAIAPEDLRQSAVPDQPTLFEPKQIPLAEMAWRFPPGAVAAVGLSLARL
jgi:alpha-N-arabinofuranosidase